MARVTEFYFKYEVGYTDPKTGETEIISTTPKYVLDPLEDYESVREYALKSAREFVFTHLSKIKERVEKYDYEVVQKPIEPKPVEPVKSEPQTDLDGLDAFKDFL